MGVAGKTIVEEVLAATPKVINLVSAGLPRNFPDQVASAILNGLGSMADRLDACA
jgi:hypothetical protein